jgi:HAD superfamily hydrolase (TIGR01509 family)
MVPRAVIFDAGNTLWFEAAAPDPARIDRMQAERVAPLLREWGIALDDPLEVVIRDVWETAEAAYEQAYASGRYVEPSLPFLTRGAMAVRGHELTEEQAEAWWRAAYLPVREFGIQLYPDTLDVLAAVKELGLLVGVCTNRPFTSEMFRPDLDDYGIGRYADAVVCSADVGHVKPHEAPFRLVLERLGVEAGDAVMVGDGCEVDIAGAKAVGMTTVWKLNGRYNVRPCADADYSIHDLGELLALPLFDGAARPAAVGESPTPHEDDNEDRY